MGYDNCSHPGFIASLLSQNRQPLHRAHVIRLLRRDLPVNLLRIAQPPGLLVPHRQLK